MSQFDEVSQLSYILALETNVSMVNKGLVTVAIASITLFFVLGITFAALHSTEAKTKSYKIIMRLNVNTDFANKKTPVKLLIDNIHNKIVASKKVDINAEINDQDEEEIIMGTLKVNDKKDQHINQVEACVSVNHANDDQRCDSEFTRESKGVYSVFFNYNEILNLVFK